MYVCWGAESPHKYGDKLVDSEYIYIDRYNDRFRQTENTSQNDAVK